MYKNFFYIYTWKIKTKKRLNGFGVFFLKKRGGGKLTHLRSVILSFNWLSRASLWRESVWQAWCSRPDTACAGRTQPDPAGWGTATLGPGGAGLDSAAARALWSPFEACGRAVRAAPLVPTGPNRGESTVLRRGTQPTHLRHAAQNKSTSQTTALHHTGAKLEFRFNKICQFLLFCRNLSVYLLYFQHKYLNK